VAEKKYIFIIQLQLRNRKHVPCFFRVIETRVKVWKNENAVGTRAVRVLPNFHSCFYNSIETRRTCFLFLLENTATQKRKSTCLLRSSKCKFSLLALYLRQQLVLVLCFNRVILKPGFKPISARICFGLFSKYRYNRRMKLLRLKGNGTFEK